MGLGFFSRLPFVRELSDKRSTGVYTIQLLDQLIGLTDWNDHVNGALNSRHIIANCIYERQSSETMMKLRH